MNTPGGNEGALIRMYQPRSGRCIVQYIVLVGLCWIGGYFTMNIVTALKAADIQQDSQQFQYL